MGSLDRRVQQLEELYRASPGAASLEASSARARMKAILDEIAAARREGREPSEEAAAVMEAIERRRRRES